MTPKLSRPRVSACPWSVERFPHFNTVQKRKKPPQAVAHLCFLGGDQTKFFQFDLAGIASVLRLKRGSLATNEIAPPAEDYFLPLLVAGLAEAVLVGLAAVLVVFLLVAIESNS